jgi:putative peptidoglycan lipid II flippase
MTTESARAARTPALSHVARSSLLVAAFFALDKGLGFVRQIIIGRQFGVSAELDAFNAANNLPDLLFALISGGALALALIPVLSDVLERQGRPPMWELFSRIGNWAFLLTSGLALVIAAFAGPIVRSELGIAPGFTPDLQALVVSLMRLNLIATLIFSLSGLVMAGLQANQHFLLPAMAPVFYDLGQIFGALVLAPTVGLALGPLHLPAAGMGVHGLVLGVILGACFHLAIQIPGLLRFRFRWSPRLGLHHPGLLQVTRLLGPRILTIGAFNLIFIVQDNLASRLGVGAVTALAFGWLIMQVPETIVGTALGTALLPTLSEQAARGDERAFEASLGRAVQVLLAFSLPVTVVLAIVIRPLVQAAFGFDAAGTDLVAWATRAYLLGLAGHSLLEVAARAFYARKDARTPLLASLLSALVFVATGIGLFKPLGAPGIGLANSLAFSFEAGLLLVLLARRYPSLGRQGRPLARILLGTLLGGACAWWTLGLWPGVPLLGAMAALAAGGALSLGFVIPELRLLRRL